MDNKVKGLQERVLLQKDLSNVPQPCQFYMTGMGSQLNQSGFLKAQFKMVEGDRGGSGVARYCDYRRSLLDGALKGFTWQELPYLALL